MKLRLYLDTSVFSARHDDRLSDRRIQTEEFWLRIGEFDASTSHLTEMELNRTPDPDRRHELIELLAGINIVAITDEMQQLATDYVNAGIFGFAMLNDAIHVAAAVLSRQDILVSWNFKHLVNRRRRAMVNEVNVTRGLPIIEIVAPPEV